MIWQAKGHHQSPKMRPNKPTLRSKITSKYPQRNMNLVITTHAILLFGLDDCQ
jgi:hypothetical protein